MGFTDRLKTLFAAKPESVSALTNKPTNRSTANLTNPVDIAALLWYKMVISGFISQNPDPVLIGQLKSVADYKKLLIDNDVFTAFQTRTTSFKNKPWAVEAPDDATPMEDELAEFVTEVFEGFNFNEFRALHLRNVLLVGYSPVQYIWTVGDDNTFRLKDITVEEPHWFGFDGDNQLQTNPIHQGIITPEKFGCATYGENNTPYGAGLGRVLYWLVYLKKPALINWGKLLFRLGGGAMYGFLPPGATATEYTNCENALKNLMQGGLALFPNETEIESKELNNNGEAFDKLVNGYFKASIAEVILGQSGTTINTGGSLAKTEVLDDIRLDILQSDAIFMDDWINRNVIPLLIWLNYGDAAGSRLPMLQTDYEPYNLQERKAITFKTLAEMGYQFTKGYIEEQFKLPPSEDPDELLSTGAQSDTGVPDDDKDSDNKLETDKADDKETFAEVVTPEDKYMETEMLANEATDAYDGAIDTALMAIVEKAKNFDDARLQMVKWYGESSTNFGNMDDLEMKLYALSQTIGFTGDK